QIVSNEIPCNEVRCVAGRAAVIGAWLDGAVATAIDRNLTTRLQRTTLGLQVDDTGAAQAVFSREAPGDQLQGRDHPWRQGLAEEADAVREDDAIQPELQAIVIATNVQLSEGVLRRIGYLQHDLVELDVLAARLGLDGLGVEFVGGGARICID